MVLSAILLGIGGLLAGAFVAGFGAAKALEAMHGAREGAAAMAGFFYFGPIGGIAGALLGAGLALRFGGSSASGKGLLIASGVISVLGGVLFAIVAAPEGTRSYSHVIEFEMEVPEAVLAGIDIPGLNAMWGAAGDTRDDKPISQFFEKRCENGVCVLHGSVAATGPLNNFRINVHLGAKQYRLPLDLPPSVTGPVDWTEPRPFGEVSLRWRIVAR